MTATPSRLAPTTVDTTADWRDVGAVDLETAPSVSTSAVKGDLAVTETTDGSSVAVAT